MKRRDFLLGATALSLGASHLYKPAISALNAQEPAPDGAATLAEALRRLDSAGIDLADIALRRPSLDDVFLSITGHSGGHQ